jgi:predicted nucleic acid-binding protein
LSLAAESSAAFLVTNDRRHLLRLRRHDSTRIVTPTRFLAELPK